MPQHKSAAKRVRQDANRNERNRTHRSKMRSMIKLLRQTTDKTQGEAQLSPIKALLDRMAAKGIIHKNMAANYKSELEKHVSRLG